jgi:integrase
MLGGRKTVLKKFNALTARAVATLKKPGRHADGGGLYLKIDSSGAKRWVFMWERKVGDRRVQREAGLGSIHSVPLVKAREKAASYRAILDDGLDPIEARKQDRAEKQGRKTFGDVANDLLEASGPSWRNEKHRAQWRMTLEVYGKPLWDRPVDEIDTAAVYAVLKPLWQDKAETASRLRGRIEAVLNRAKVLKLRSGENPATWRGNLDGLLPKAARLSARGNHAAMPYKAVADFVAKLREREAIAAAALEFLILTAARTGEVLGAEWAEFDLKDKVWTVPAKRMKANREHRVPLSPRAVEIIEELAKVRIVGSACATFVFPGQRLDKPLSNMALEMVLRRMGIHDATVHGFRSAFRDWCGEETHFPREIAEAALAHVIGDKAERAYRRGDALEKRRALMAAWAIFISAPAGSA